MAYDLHSREHSLRCQIGAANGWTKIYEQQGDLRNAQLQHEKAIELKLELAKITGCGLCRGMIEWIQFLDGNHPEEKMNYCPRCGRKIG